MQENNNDMLLAQRKLNLSMTLDMTVEQWAEVDGFISHAVNEMLNEPAFAELRTSMAYILAKLSMQIDMELHKQVKGMCKLGDPGCALRGNLERFQKAFAEEIAADVVTVDQKGI